jgi:sterol desaturase/sphingolipid hydroxylase (fatty acid hydroxylase superfamily)
MVSEKSLKNFMVVNGFLLGLSCFMEWFRVFFVATLLRNVIIMFFIHIGTKSKPGKQMKITREDVLYLASSTCIQSATELLIPHGTYVRPFVLQLFMFEITLDFFHYWAHRLSHMYFYRWHKVHHKHTSLVLINTWCHHPLDLIMIESIPTLLAFYLFPLEKSTALVYKSFIEISGHSGKKTRAI